MKAIIILFTFIPFLSQAQNSLVGSILDDYGIIEFANIIISDMQGQFIAGDVSNEKGAFKITLAEGSYIMSVSHINYLDYDTTVTISGVVVLEPIRLKEHSTKLDEVVVTARKSIIKRMIDKTVVNIENNPIAQNSTLFDALKSIPGLVVQNNAIAMLGRSSVRVAIDGRMLELSGDDLNSFLATLSASDVKEVEVITNPSSKFEAEGNSGIVNIISKRSKEETWRNSLSVSHSQARYGWQSISNNFNYQKEKLSLILSTSINTGSQYFRQLVEPKYTERPLIIDSNQKNSRKSIVPRVLLDYQQNESTNMGFQYLGSYANPLTIDGLKTTVFNREREVINYLVADGASYNRTQYNSSYNIFFDKKLDTLGRSLTLNLDVIDYTGDAENNIKSEQYDKDYKYLNTEFSNVTKSLYDISNFSAKLDIEHPVHWINLSYGLKSMMSNSKYRLDNFNTITGQAVLNPILSNSFNFNEAIHSAYFSSFKKFNDKWECQFGLRYEYTDTEGGSDQSETSEPIFTNTYGQLFPTFYTRFSASDDHIFSFNFGRRINRPAYAQLNPARVFLNSQSSQLGNPYLLPSFSNNIELVHVFKSNFSTTLSFSHITDAYSFIFDLNDELQEQVITYKNLFKEDRLSIRSDFSLDISPWWNSRQLLYYGYSHSDKINAEEDITLNNGSRLYVSMNNHFNLNKAKTISGEVNFWYDSKYQANLYQFEKSYATDLSIHFKSVTKGLNISLTGFDIFNTSPRTVSSQVNGVNHDFTAYLSNRNVRVSLSYNFGNEKISNQDRSFGNEEVRRRSN